MGRKGKRKVFVDYRQQCVAGTEHLSKLLENSSTTLTPLLKVATLPDDGNPSIFSKMSAILSSFDDRKDPSGLELTRLPYVTLVFPLTEDEEAQEEEEETCYIGIDAYSPPATRGSKRPLDLKLGGRLAERGQEGRHTLVVWVEGVQVRELGVSHR